MKAVITTFLFLGLTTSAVAQSTIDKEIEQAIASIPSTTDVASSIPKKKPKAKPVLNEKLNDDIEAKIEAKAEILHKRRDIAFINELKFAEKAGNLKTGTFPTCRQVAKNKKDALQLLINQETKDFWSKQKFGNLDFYKKNIDTYVDHMAHKHFRAELSKSIDELSAIKIEPSIVTDVSVGGDNYILTGLIYENGTKPDMLASVQIENAAKNISELKTKGTWDSEKKNYVLLSEASSYWDDSDGKDKIICWGQLLDIVKDTSVNTEDTDPDDVKYELALSYLDGVKKYAVDVKASLQYSFSNDNGEIEGLYNPYRLAHLGIIIIDTRKKVKTNFYTLTIAEDGFYIGEKSAGYTLIQNKID
jgi:hypothetical protein